MAAKSMTSRKRTQSTPVSYDWGLLTIVVTLLALGTIMVFSASFAQGVYGFGNPLHFFIRQIAWMLVGITALILAARLPYTFWERWSIPLMGVTLLALLAVIALGSETFGATRFFYSGSIQPSEPAKIVIIVYISTWLASKGTRIRDVQVGLLPFGVLMGVVTVLLVSQPDISTAILIVVTATVMFFIAGAELKQLIVVGLGGATTFWLVIQYSAHARGRVDRYLASIWDPLQSSEWQVWQGVRALLRGGIFGVGLGNGEAKLPGYLPVSWSDNIFAVVGEELGLLGALLVIFLFTMLAYRGLRAALRAPDNFGMLLATGLTSLLILQAILNTAVTVAVAPPTGVTLPFISYGGSSLVTVLGGVGILLSISRANRLASSNSSNSGRAPYARFDFGWRNRGTRIPGAGSRSSTPTSRRPAGKTYSAETPAGRRSGRLRRSRSTYRR
jgi:cell division protein FtsW